LFERFGRYFSWLFSSPRILDLNRCSRDDIVRAVKSAQANHPGAMIYVLTDMPVPAVPGTRQIADVKSLAGSPTPCAVVLACNSDARALEAVEYVKGRAGMFYYGADRNVPAARYFHRDEHARAALKESEQASLAKFDFPDFENIAQAIHATRMLTGDYVEIGVYKGSSAYFALNYMQRAGIRRRSFFLDTFSGFDYAGAESSIDRAWFKTHTDSSQEAVRDLLAGFNVPYEIVRSNIIADPLPGGIKQIAVCNIDVDMYEAVAAALAKAAPLVVEGGIIIAEDQGHTPLLIGAYAATSEFLNSPAGRHFVPVEMMSGQMFLIKTRGTQTAT
jgi:hypothetical protein